MLANLLTACMWAIQFQQHVAVSGFAPVQAAHAYDFGVEAFRTPNAIGPAAKPLLLNTF